MTTQLSDFAPARIPITGILANNPALTDCLTDTQLVTLDMLVKGMTVKEIVKATGRGTNTVAEQVKAIYKKFNVRNRVQVVLLFVAKAESRA